MKIKGIIKKGEYFDSVTLMRVAQKVSNLSGVVDSAIIMGTKENLSILEHAGLNLPEFADVSASDLLIAISGESDKTLSQAFAEVEKELTASRKKTLSPSGTNSKTASSINSALNILPDANLALISVAGRFAGDEAMKALEMGLHVMIFSDNVSIEKEIELKKFAHAKGLLVMGPDSGTAIINGVPLAFANVVNRGEIGIVAASGTGLQEVSCIISNEGAGISQAIGTGGRDVKKDVGGIMFIDAMKALDADPDTKVILLVSKPPHEEVLKKIEAEASKIRKPIVTVFLGAAKTTKKTVHNLITTTTLEEAALTAVEISKGGSGSKISAKLSKIDSELEKMAKKITERALNKSAKKRRYVRGLFSGGTFCTEAQLILSQHVKDIYSNAPTGKTLKLENSLESKKHTLVDLGEDEFTVGRPHPMIDFTLRVKRIEEEAQDPETSVILLDVVLGYGSNMDPSRELEKVVKEASKKVAVVCSITGTNLDPQGRKKIEDALQTAGATVVSTNRRASLLASYIAKELI